MNSVFRFLRVLPALLATVSAVEAAELNITVRQVLPQQGELLVALYDTAEGWPDQPRPTQTAQRLQAGGDTMTLTFSDLTPGRWAVMVLQDLNGNGRVDKNFVGLPKEPYGASNNRLPRMAPPAFKEALVDVGPSGATLIIELRRP